MVRKILMVAFHFPPVHGSSGVQRTLKFAQYLPDYGWEPIVLSVNPRAYKRTDFGQVAEIKCVVKRAFALDTARHLAVGRFYPKMLAIPDRWSSWWLGAVPVGLSMIKQYQPDVIWSTFPVATAHLIGLTLQKISNKPWIADFRDSMTEEGYPSDPLVRRSYKWIERNTIRRCTHAVYTTPGARSLYEQRYQSEPEEKWKIIENAYDEENFQSAEKIADNNKNNSSKLVFLHSGILYPSERDPSSFFNAICELKDEGTLSGDSLEVVLRATGHDKYYKEVIKQLKLDDIVFIEPAIPYSEALAEMLTADCLVVLQAANCNHQIPAKIYEYIRAARPIFALTDPEGDTAAALKNVSINTIVKLDSREEIKMGLINMINRIKTNSASVASTEDISRNSRKARTKELATILDSLVGRI